MRTTILAVALTAAALGLAQHAAAETPAEDPIVASFERAFGVQLRQQDASIAPAPASDVLTDSFERTLGITVDGVIQPPAKAEIRQSPPART
ncbi:MAG TPA: hypothetical protein VK025_16315 [Steroidobacter sp.]|jgi:hypothetical protein|nr:hypothetical protein [Steroidobacteraceae bacterium]HLS82967.1 hypothetical protein [Steroidobacter sp.]